ncbi:substrate-binding periplasmic protein [Massilia sp. TWP1-3-3]|uniref:substrate-binding periplasmic protein n=1 Tax=Massilia sp. TWP1-3-3 TaxID=2804573 RepID=UPI003CF2AC73
MFFFRWRLFLLIAALCAPSIVAAEVVVRYPRPESAPDERSYYPLRLLAMALERADIAYRVEQHPVRMLQGRALLRLENGDGIDVVSTMTSTEREARLLPIRIPLDKGLIGWRLLLINKTHASTFNALRSINDLKRLTAGQGSDWPDTSILRANGLNVYGTSNYAALFSMLESERIDYFPRSVTEIWAELALYQQRLAVEPSVVLHYPTAIYFFVRQGNTQLAADITDGLEKMIADGSFEKLFQRYYGATIRKAALKERRVFELKNPLMPKDMPIGRKALWFHE